MTPLQYRVNRACIMMLPITCVLGGVLYLAGVTNDRSYVLAWMAAGALAALTECRLASKRR